MRSLARISLCIFTLLGASAALAAEPPQRLRDQAVVTVRGVKETWQLVWGDKPVPVCGADDVVSSITCPCSGFAYGEAGHLSLVRRHGGEEIQRMSLGPLFENAEHPFVDYKTGDAGIKDAAYLNRRPLVLDDLRREEAGDSTLAAEIARRPQSKVIRPADYDHDGGATEFLLQVGTEPCGKHQFVAVGVSKDNPNLHALVSARKPDEPLVLPLQVWEALRKQQGPATVSTWDCGDHGAENRTEMVVSAIAGQIHVRERRFSCPENGSAEKLIEETDQ